MRSFKSVNRVALAGLCVTIGMLTACKDQINRHVPPEADPEMLLLSQNAPSAPGQPAYPAAGTSNKIELTVNNAPGPTQPLEQELAFQEIALFERKNPDIRVVYKGGSFTPEGFYERVRNHSLTDVVEIPLSQAKPIIQLDYAAILSDLVAASPQMREVNPEVLKLMSRDGRIYGVPVELHTLALFYNRGLFERVLHPKEPAKSKPEKSKGKGAESQPRDFSESRQLAQYQQPARPYAGQGYYGQQQQPEEDLPPGYSRRGAREIQEYYNLPATPARGQRPAPGSWYDYQRQQQQPYYQQQGYGQPPMPERPRVTPAPRTEEETPSADPEESPRSGKKGRRTMDEDVLTTSEEMATTTSVVEESVTTSVRTEGLPRDWAELIHTAVKMTDHSSERYGFAPVLFANEGGREFTQWAMQVGLQIEITSGETTSLDINTTGAAEVVQFLKDLRWHYDVTPPVERCYNDNLMRMFAEGKIAMMALPATRETIQRLLKLGMQLDDIGIAALPAGPANRDHLTFGRCLIINSQIDKERRAAAFKWLLFQLDPDRLALREQFYSREQEMTGGPQVPLFTEQAQRRLDQRLQPFRSLPLYLDYVEHVAEHLRPEPSFYTEKLYETIAQGVRPIIEQQESDPMRAIATLGLDFENRYLRAAPTQHGLDRYLKMFTQKSQAKAE